MLMCVRLLLFIILSVPVTGVAQTWQQQAIAQPVPGLWGISMFDLERGVAVGNASITSSLSGVIRRQTGNPTWQLVPTGSFTPALASSFPFWSGVSSVRNTGSSWICGSNALIYQSSDYGASWQRKTTGISGSGSFFDVFFKNLNEGLVVGASGSAYYTTDGGSSWTPQSTGTTNGLYSIHSAGNNWFIGGANNTMLKFTPPSTWVDISGNLPGGSFPLIEGLQFLSDQVGTFSGYNAGGSTHVYRTTNGGTTWQGFPTNPPVGSFPFYSSVYFFTAKIGWVSNAFDPVAYTSNGGNTWTGYSPSGSGTGAVTRMDFLNQQSGWASGGALGGGPIPQGYVLKFDGPPPSPDISQTQTTMNFGNVRCILQKDTVVWLKNAGTLDMTIPSGGITFSSLEFSLVSPSTPITIQPGDSVAITIRWTIPVSTIGTIPAGTKIFVKSNDSNHPTWEINILGFRHYSNVTLNPPTITFPTICGTSFADTTIIITPDASIPVTVLGLEYVVGDSTLALISPPANTVLSGPTPFVFRLLPKRMGTLNGEYRLRIGDIDCPGNVHVSFSGNYRKNTLTASPGIVDFGDLCVGVPRDLDITLKNDGNNTGTMDRREFISGADVFPNMYSSPFGPISAGGSAQYKVRFLPPDTGVYVANYRLIAGPCADTTVITLRGRGVRINVATQPSTKILLGPVSINQTVTQSVTFTNNGMSPVTVTAVRITPTSSDLTLTGVPALPMTVARGKDLTCTVHFTPTKIESITTNVCIVLSQPCDETVCVPLSAVSADPPSIVSRTIFNLALQQCGTPVRDSFYVKNLGPGPLNLLSFNISGVDAAHFNVVRPVPPVLINAQDSLPIVIEYNSLVEKTSSAKLTINHNDPMVGNTSTISLNGERTVTEFIIEGDTATVILSCVKSPATRQFLIRNPSPRPLQITEMRVVQGTGSYSVTGETLPVVIPPSTTKIITVTFTPAGAGPMDGLIQIVSEPCHYSVVFRVPGFGKASGIVLLPPTVNFGTVTLGSIVTRPVQITNAGPEAVTVTGLLVSPSNSALSVLTPPSFPLTLSPNDSRSLTLQYQPTNPGTLLLRFCAITSAPCPDTICTSVLGLAQAEGISFDREQMDLILEPCSEASACDTILLMNNSARDLIISDVSFDSPGFLLSTPLSTPFPLTSGTQRLIVICAEGMFTGQKSAKLIVRSNDPNRPVIELPLTATRDSVHISIDRQLIEFGKVGCDLPKTVTIAFANTGTLDDSLVIIRRLSLPFAFPAPDGFSVGAGKSLNMGVAFAPTVFGDYRDTLIVESIRCRQRFTVPVHGDYPRLRYDITPQPLVFSTIAVGGNEARDLTVKNLFLEQSRISNVQVVPSTEFSYTGPSPVTIDSAGSATLPLRFSPIGTGTRSATVILTFDQPCSETDTVHLTGIGSDVPVFFMPSPLAFGLHAHCEQVTLDDTLFNNGVNPVGLTASVISGSGQSAFTILNPVMSNEQLAAGKTRVFTIQFTPSAPPDGPVTAILTVSTTDPAHPTIDLPLNGERTTLVYPTPAPVNFGTIQLGIPVQQIVTLRNPGMLPIRYSAANLPSGITLTPALPLTVLPGQNVAITVTFTADAPGSQSITFSLLSSEPCNDSTRIEISADVLGGILQRDLIYGFVPMCVETTGSLFIRNTLSSTCDLTSIHISGPDSGFFRIVSPLALPRPIPPGDSLQITIVLSPDSSATRAYFASCVSTINPGTGPSFVSSTLLAQTYKPVPMLSQTIDFGDVTITTGSPARRMVLRNIFPQTMRVAELRSLDTAFSIVSVTPPLPTVLQPLDSIVVVLQFSPLLARQYVGEIELVSDQPCRGYWKYPALAGNGIDDLVHATISVPALQGRVGERIRVPVMLNTDVGTAKVRSWSGSIVFNTSMLYPERIVTDGTVSQDMNVDGSFDAANQRYTFVASGGAIRSGTGPLVFLECLVLIGDAGFTSLGVSPDFDFTSGLSRVYSHSNGSFTLVDYCDYGGTRYVASLNGLVLSQNRPNPFNPSTVIEYSLPTDGHTELVIHDAMGRPIQTLIQAFQLRGHHSLTVEVGNLPSGLYFYTLYHETGQLTRPMILSK